MNKWRKLMNKTHPHVWWTNGNPVTAGKMVIMYTILSIIHSWWEKVTLIIWGEPTKLVSKDANIQEKIKEAFNVGVHITV